MRSHVEQQKKRTSYSFIVAFFLCDEPVVSCEREKPVASKKVATCYEQGVALGFIMTTTRPYRSIDASVLSENHRWSTLHSFTLRKTPRARHITNRPYAYIFCATAFPMRHKQTAPTRRAASRGPPRPRPAPVARKTTPTDEEQPPRHQLRLCIACQRLFGSCAALQMHRRYEHVAVKRFACRDCRRVFRRKLSLLAHTRRAHGYAYVCRLCGARLRAREDFAEHTTVHREQRKAKPSVSSLLF